MKPACGPDFLGPLLGHATHLARERMDARLSRYDMTPSQTHTLLYLSSHGYTAPQRDVVEHLRVRPSTANGILDRMEEKGLIRTEPSTIITKDGRVRNGSLVYTIRPIQEALELNYQRQFLQAEHDMERAKAEKRLAELNRQNKKKEEESA